MINPQSFEPDMILIPEGQFLMGSDRVKTPDSKYTTEPDLMPMILPQFYIGKYEVTVGEYRMFIDDGGYLLGEAIWGHYGRIERDKNQIKNPFAWSDPVITGDDRLPVMGLCWYEAMAYCRWLSGKTGLHYRLPAEAEWEKAARGTDAIVYPWGDTFEDGYCNCSRKRFNCYSEGQAIYDFTLPVGSFPQGASPYGAMDMSGNVREWCLDKKIDLSRYPEHADPQRNPADRDPDAPSSRILRGGDFECSPIYVRTAARHYLPAEIQSGGFRLAL